MPNQVPSEVNTTALGGVLCVGRDPGGRELDYRRDELTGKDYPHGRPFVGPAGGLFDTVLAETGLRRQDINVTNVCGFRPDYDDFSNHDPKTVEEGVEQLHKLIAQLKPKLIVTMGNEAAYALVPDWPTRGKGIFGAKSITDRRGYFWRTPHGLVLTTLHPAGVLRQPVPGNFLLRKDFQRAGKYLRGQLPREEWPAIQRLDSEEKMRKLMYHNLLGWDIETKWGSTAILTSGFCGDDEIPYVAAGWELRRFAYPLLQSGVPLVGHNGGNFDLPAMKLFEGTEIPIRNRSRGYMHDTQQLWWALEPDLAGGEEETEEETAKSKMTRKGLAFLASLIYHIDWWKNYPDNDDPDHLDKMILINGIDSWVTRGLTPVLLKEVQEAGVLPQYTQAMELYKVLVDIHLRGLPVNNELREERIAILQERAESGADRSRSAALEYIKLHDLRFFSERRKCECCGGGKKQRGACWRCADLPRAPDRNLALARGFKTLKDLKGIWLPANGWCKTCEGTGRIVTYDFNPFSVPQAKKLLYDILGAPQQIWKKKVILDESAMRKVMRWASSR